MSGNNSLIRSPGDLLADALARHTRQMGEQPWLFHRDEEDWRWISWSSAAQRVGTLRQRLSSASPRRIAYRAGPFPDAYLADLALRLEGFDPVPLEREAEESSRGHEIDLADPFFVPEEGQPELRDWRPDLERLDQLLGNTSRRDVVVIGSGPADHFDRLLLDWILLHGGAAAFEHDPALLFMTSIWVRPTIHHGPSTLLSGLTAYLAEQPKPRRDLMKRARMTLDGGPEGLSEEEASLWNQYDIRVVDVAAFFGTQSASG